MVKIQKLKLALLTILSMLAFEYGTACSMYKISHNGKTMVGSNYDAYYLTAKIWYENAISGSGYGAVFIGARSEGSSLTFSSDGAGSVCGSGSG
jgi:hypothetical protein